MHYTAEPHNGGIMHTQPTKRKYEINFLLDIFSKVSSPYSYSLVGGMGDVMVHQHDLPARRTTLRMPADVFIS